MFFYPKTIETRKSKINGEIKVVKLLGTYRLVVGKYTQSGGLVYSIWKKALKKIKKQIKSSKPKILILGLGAGNAAEIANQYWPKAKIIGIDLDKIIIELGKKYFLLDKISNLTIIQTDAIKWVTNKSKEKKEAFDIIIIDLYIGTNPPKEVSSDYFLKQIHRLLSLNGLAVFNRLTIKGQRQKTKKFKSKLETIFKTVQKVPTPANLVLSVHK